MDLRIKKSIFVMKNKHYVIGLNGIIACSSYSFLGNQDISQRRCPAYAVADGFGNDNVGIDAFCGK